MTWLAVGLLAAGTLALRLLGPWLARRVGDGRGRRVLDLLPAALVAALVVLGAFHIDEAVHADARTAGVGAAAVAILLRAPMLVVVVVAAATAAALRCSGVG